MELFISSVEAGESAYGTRGVYQEFESGNIYWNSKQDKSWIVDGMIYELYALQYGGPKGVYGYPIRDFSNGCQEFERDRICFNKEDITELEEFINEIVYIDEYIHDEVIVGVLFRFLEPEPWWDYAAPQTNIYANFSNKGINNITCKSGINREICIKEVQNFLNKISLIVECDQILGCNNTTAKRLENDFRDNRVNIGHVFAGISEHYFKDINPLLYNYINISLAGYPDTNIRSYIGDYGAVLGLWAGYQKFETWTDEQKLENLERLVISGLLEKGDLFADIDSYQINNQITRLGLAAALESYYLEENNSFQMRANEFGTDELSVKIDNSSNKIELLDMNIFAKRGIQIQDFGFVFIRYPEIVNCLSLSDMDNCVAEITQNKIIRNRLEFAAPSFTQNTLYNQIGCLALDEYGSIKCEIYNLEIK